MNKNNLLKLALTLIMPLTLCIGSSVQGCHLCPEKQPGVAKLTKKSNSYQLANRLLKASLSTQVGNSTSTAVLSWEHPQA